MVGAYSQAELSQVIADAGFIDVRDNWIERSFVVRPLQQLPFFKTLEKCFKIPTTFDVEAKPIN